MQKCKLMRSLPNIPLIFVTYKEFFFQAVIIFNQSKEKKQKRDMSKEVEGAWKVGIVWKRCKMWNACGSTLSQYKLSKGLGKYLLII